jgi:hypothetical protein
MDEHATAGDNRAPQSVREPVTEVPPARRRRLQLRHEAAVVASEIQRMRRLGWSDASRPDAASAG